MTRRRVVVTGMGVISAAGSKIDDFWQSLVEGKSGVKPIDRFDAAEFPTRIAAQISNFVVEEYIPRREARRMDLFVQYACAAAIQAVEEAGCQVDDSTAHRVGVWIGTGVGGIDTIEKQHQVMLKRGPGSLNPFLVPMMIPNMAAGQVSIRFGAKGPCGCTVTACASGTNSIGEAFRFIQNNLADVMIAGGSEAAITPLAIGGFCAAKAMSTTNDEPARACLPFDLHRSGFVMGEGAGIVVLEELQHAQARGAKIYAELVGYGSSSDAFHMVQPDENGAGAALAFRQVMEDAGLQPGDVGYINAHGTGTQLNDAMETRAIKTVFGEAAHKLAVSSIKPATGHMLGAAGAVEFIATALALQKQIIPMTIGLTTPDPCCDLDYVPQVSRPASFSVALTDSLGFGGHNAVLALKQWSEG